MLLIALPVPGINADSHKHSSFSKFILSIVTLCSLPFTAAYLKVLLSKPTPDSISCHEKANKRDPGLFLFTWFLKHFHGNHHKNRSANGFCNNWHHRAPTKYRRQARNWLCLPTGKEKSGRMAGRPMASQSLSFLLILGGLIPRRWCLPDLCQSVQLFHDSARFRFGDHLKYPISDLAVDPAVRYVCVTFKAPERKLL